LGARERHNHMLTLDRLQGHVSGRHLKSALPHGEPGDGTGREREVAYDVTKDSII
jgi:hypothetical protein